MESRTNLAWDVLLDLGDRREGPLHARLAHALRDAIRTGRLTPGSAVPPSRLLAKELGCSRWVVTEAYSQLVAEGYLEATTGSATRVSDALSDVPDGAAPTTQPTATARYDLVPGLPDLRGFPRSRWHAAVQHAVTSIPYLDLRQPDPAGHERCRAVLAAYLHRVRGAAASPERLVMCRGVTDAVVRLARGLVAAGIGRIAVEDPGWTRLREAVRSAGMEPVPVPVDDDGLDVEVLDRSDVGAVLVTPAHQFPTGTVLSPQRRTELIAWAQRSAALIVEDDYDAEFRYDRPPVATLQGMAPDRVALVGSLSKTLSPALGIGWALAPERWLPALEAPVAGPPPVIDQLAFAELVESGGYDRHLRRARRAHRARRDALLAALAEQLPDCRTSGVAAGLHVLLHLPDGARASQVVEAAADRGLRLADLDRYGVGRRRGEALVLGYANLAEHTAAAAVADLAAAIRAADAGGELT